MGVGGAAQFDEAVSKRIEGWKGKLLDLSLKNRLINMRDSGNVLSLACDDSPALYEAFISSGKPYGFVKGPGGDQKTMLKPLHTDSEAYKRLYKIYLRAHESLAEQAVNTLFLALGVLEYDDKETGARLRAPIVLVPAKIERRKDMLKTRHPFTLSFLDDDIYVNPALRQKILSQFGFDIQESFESVREYFSWLSSEVSKYGWQVSQNEAVLGIFSFQKLSLYKDLDKHKALAARHPIVRALCGDRAALSRQEKVLRGRELDSIDPKTSFFVLDADSSQQEAILAARSGMSFVLQGPPGTGKSQTIANIIAQMLADGKKVLFVSEKKAALEVVKKRLDSTGIGHYLLELHNADTAGKKWVLEQFEKALVENKLYSVDEKLMGQLVESRSILQKYGDELVGDLGDYMPVYEILGRLAKLDHIKFSAGGLGVILDFGEFKRNKAILEEIDRYEHQLQNYKTSILANINNVGLSEFTDLKRAQLEESLSVALENIEYIKREAEELRTRCGISIRSVSAFRQQEAVLRLLESLPKTRYKIDENWLTLDHARLSRLLREYNTAAGEKSALEGYFSSKYSPELLSYEKLDEMHALFNKWYKHSLVRLVDPRYAIYARKMCGWLKERKKLTFEEMLDDLNKLAVLKSSSAEAARLAGEISSLICSEEISPPDISAILAWVERAKAIPGAYNNVLIKSLASGYDPSQLAASLRKHLEAFLPAYLDVAAIFMPEYVKTGLDTAGWDLLDERLDETSKSTGEISKWVEFKDAIGELSREVRNIFERCMEDEHRNYKVSELYEKIFLQTHLGRIQLDVAKRSREYLDLAHTKFVESDREHKYYSRNQIIQLIESKKPKLSLTSDSSEIGILKKEIGKTRRHKPLRQLFSEIKNLVFVLKPCFMMSPLSVARIIDPEVLDFDVVIFDEASQIMVEDAISSIIRTKQAIIVGDSKQLPPTMFFKVNEDSDDEDAPDEAVSILEEAAPVLGNHMLKWHYRSKDESLISFSNRHFYNGELITFPNNKVESFAIEFIHVPNGVYERGGSRQNRAEARRIVSLIKEHFDRTPDKSLGVIAFSIAQQQAILDELDDFVLKNPQYSKYLNGDGLRGFFVKNLETVQGDEREVIILSVGYGRDADGRLSLNFGPLNKEGGAKRLNVAISRAIERVLVVSSILPEEIEASKSASEGIAMLKRYLEYAKSGTASTFRAVHFDSDMQEAVYNRLLLAGFGVHKNIGTSRFNIDVAISDPRDPSRYALAIELDSKAYLSSQSTRDRDRIRREMLEALGWKVHRIWSYDWFLNPENEVENIRRMVAVGGPTAAATQEQKKKRKEPVGNELSFAIKPYSRLDIGTLGDAQSFLRIDFYPKIKEIVRAESPVHVDVVRSRIFSAFGVKESASAKRRFDEVLAMHKEDPDVTFDGELVWWGQPKLFVEVRRSDDDNSRQGHIPLPEIRLAVLIVVDSAKSILREDIPRDVAKIYGIGRMSPKFRARVNLAINELLANNYLKEGEKVTVNPEAFTKK
ncbi:MAG: DUF4011 domain-containing protein [Candidatus Micrarchaeota archaeon]|nr:DUF4011 domain-containing protein [Candidatus Micrarchaeota archaeon]